MSLESGERDAALARLVAVMDQEARHATRLTLPPHPYIGHAPVLRTLISAPGYARAEVPDGHGRSATRRARRGARLAGPRRRRSHAERRRRDAARRRARDRQDPAARRAGGTCGRARPRCSPEARRSWRPTCRSGSSSTRWRSTSPGSSPDVSLPSTTTCAASWRVMFPAMPATAPASGPAAQDERYRAHRAVRELLEASRSPAPLVLVLDDVHWADAASVELLAALLRRPPSAAVLLALGARPRQLPPRLAGALERADRAGWLTRIELGALRREEATELLGDAVDDEFAEPLRRERREPVLPRAARAVRRPADRRLAGPGRARRWRASSVPPAVAASVTEELALLSAGTRQVLEGAAVAGDPFEPELAAAAAAVDETAVAHAVDELLALGLIRATDVPRRFRFRHPLIRRAVYDAAPGGWRLGAHERCARQLAERGASPAAARTTWSMRRATAMWRPSRCSARLAWRQPREPRRTPRTGSARPCALLPANAPRRAARRPLDRARRRTRRRRAAGGCPVRSAREHRTAPRRGDRVARRA